MPCNCQVKARAKARVMMSQKEKVQVKTKIQVKGQEKTLKGLEKMVKARIRARVKETASQKKREQSMLVSIPCSTRLQKQVWRGQQPHKRWCTLKIARHPHQQYPSYHHLHSLHAHLQILPATRTLSRSMICSVSSLLRRKSQCQIMQ